MVSARLILALVLLLQITTRQAVSTTVHGNKLQTGKDQVLSVFGVHWELELATKLR